MALSVNNKNVMLYSFVSNDEIKLLKLSDLVQRSLEHYILKCPFPHCSKNVNASDPTCIKDHYVVSIAVSVDCNYVAACDSSNFLHLWKLENNVYKHLSTRLILRKSQKIVFTNLASELILADRSGDVYSFSLVNDQEKGKFLLGHISLIIDITISSDDRYLLTSDRDGKIRVSYYPNCYNIHSYCLGHQEFVSSVQCIELSKELILSASGDGSLKLWNFDGDNMGGVNLFENDILCDKLESCGVDMKLHANQSSLTFLLDEKQVAFAVRRIIYSSKNKLCAILFYFIKGIAIYCVSDIAENFNFVQFISLEWHPFDAFFDINGHFVVLQKSSTIQYLYFKLEDTSLRFKVVTSENNPIAQKIQELYGDIQNLKEIQDDFVTLFKRQFDEKDDKVEKFNEMSKKSKIA